MTFNEPLINKKVKEFIEMEYKQYQFVIRHWNYDPGTAFLEGTEIEWPFSKKDKDEIPQSVFDAFFYYETPLFNDDWGSARLYRTPVEDEDEIIYVVKVTTDREDGWVEMFDLKGNQLAAGRTYRELISWGPVEEIRQYLYKYDEYPAELWEKIKHKYPGIRI
ncbi:MAG: hypothetical protein WBA77_11055 [Microcoleaceae cyanobacterium]